MLRSEDVYQVFIIDDLALVDVEVLVQLAELELAPHRAIGRHVCSWLPIPIGGHIGGW